MEVVSNLDSYHGQKLPWDIQFRLSLGLSLWVGYYPPRFPGAKGLRVALADRWHSTAICHQRAILTNLGAGPHLRVLHQELPGRLQGELALHSRHQLAILFPGDGWLRAALGCAGQEGVGALSGGQIWEAILNDRRDCRKMVLIWGWVELWYCRLLCASALGNTQPLSTSPTNCQAIGLSACGQDGLRILCLVMLC